MGKLLQFRQPRGYVPALSRRLARIDKELSSIEGIRSLAFGRLVSSRTQDKAYWLRLVEEADTEWTKLMIERLALLSEREARLLGEAGPREVTNV